jgi:hypothetical protein
MKKVMWTLALLLSVSVLSFGQAASQKAEGTKMNKQDMKQVDAAKIQQVSPDVAQVKQPVSFNETTVDYGTLEQGGDPYRVFTFTNNSDQPLIIKSARGSCGCTVPEIPKEPIAPGTTGEIKVKYDTQRIGAFQKSVTVYTNLSEEPVQLYIKGNVKPKPQDPEGLPGKKNPFNNNGN